MIKRSMRIVGLAFVLVFFVLFIIWQIDRIYFHPDIPNLREEVYSAINTYKFTVPQDREDCEVRGGTWKNIGIRRAEECNLPTADGGKICTASKECEGICLAELSDDELRKGMKGRLIKKDGKCSNWIKVVGCKGFVHRGWVSVVCLD